MPVSEARKRANVKWDAENMTNLACRVRKERAEEFKAACKEAGTTPNAVFLEAMDNFMEKKKNPGA